MKTKMMRKEGRPSARKYMLTGRSKAAPEVVTSIHGQPGKMQRRQHLRGGGIAR